MKLFRKSMFDSEGHPDEESIALYVDALRLGKTDRLPPGLLDHVEECGQCKATIADLFELLEETPVNRKEPHPFLDAGAAGSRTGRRARGRWPVYRIAAMLAIAVGVAAIVYLRFISTRENAPGYRGTAEHISSPRSDTSGAADSLTRRAHPGQEGSVKKGMESLYAANFVPSSNLDDLVNNPRRSGEVEVLSPVNGAVVHRPVVFEWKGGGAVTVQILSNREQLRVTRSLRTSRFVLTQDLAPGLYYWKLIADGDLVYVGKFLVK